jgi:hypothetical protein
VLFSHHHEPSIAELGVGNYRSTTIQPQRIIQLEVMNHLENGLIDVTPSSEVSAMYVHVRLHLPKGYTDNHSTEMNASAPPLLCLPPEIRNHIWELSVGQLIHPSMGFAAQRLLVEVCPKHPAL